MRTRLLIATIAVLMMSATASAQNDPEADFDDAYKVCAETGGAGTAEKCLDQALERCAGKHPSNQGGAACGRRAYVHWDKLLNVVYSDLMKKMSDRESKALRSSQRRWLKFRDAEFKVIDRVYSFEKGSMNISFNAHARLQLVRKRVMELSHYTEAF